MAEVAALARLFDEAVPGKQVADGGARRPVALGVAFAQELEEFLRAPGGMMAAAIEQGLNEVRLSLVRARKRLARAIFETASALLMIAIDPLIGSLSADAV